MWLCPARGARRVLSLRYEQRTAGVLAEPIEATLNEEVLLATPQLVRLGYHLTSPTVGDARFDLTLTTRGAIIAPHEHTSRIAMLAEEVRLAWLPLPDDVAQGFRSTVLPIVPGSLPEGLAGTSFEIRYEVLEVSETVTTLHAELTMSTSLVIDRTIVAAQGHGQMDLVLTRTQGPAKTTREAVVEVTGRSDLQVWTRVELGAD
jgi:hypothetical protein